MPPPPAHDPERTGSYFICAVEPGLAAPLRQLLSWAAAERRPAPEEVRLALAGDGIVAAVVGRFASLIGLWPGDPQNQ